MQITLCDCCGEQIIAKVKMLTNQPPFTTAYYDDRLNITLCEKCYTEIVNIATKAKREYECPTQD